MLRLEMDDVRERAQRSKKASFAMQGVPLDVRNRALKAIADQLIADAPGIVEANRRDLAEAKLQELSNVMVKRLSYDNAKVQESVRSIESLMRQEDPVGKLLGRTELDALIAYLQGLGVEMRSVRTGG